MWRNIIASLVITCFANSVTAQSAGTLANDKSNWRGLRALQKKINPVTLAAIEAKCVDGRADWRVLSNTNTTALKKHSVLLQALHKFPWKERRFLPLPDGVVLNLAVKCAPDLNADNKPEFVIRVQWTHKQKFNHVFLIGTKEKKDWHFLDVITFIYAATKKPLDIKIDYAQLPDGRIGIRGQSNVPKGDTGCELSSTWVGVLKADRFHIVGSTDPEFCPE